MSLVKFHRVDGWYEKGFKRGREFWVNPAFVVSVEPWTDGATERAQLRLAGDQSHQDWTRLWDVHVSVIHDLERAEREHVSATAPASLDTTET